VTGQLINLRSARKAKAKDAAVRAATTNAAKFGRSKAEKTAEAAAQAKAKRDLDGHARE
jgi:Domain of unknown function (DUF4169)